MVVEDRVLLVHTSQAVGMSLAHLLCQLSIASMLELSQVQEEELCCFDSYGCLELNLEVPKPEILEARDSLE